MLYCLGMDEYSFSILLKKCEVHLIIKLGIKLSIGEICIYYMHFVCCDVYILLSMLIIESMLYVFWVSFVWSALPNVFLLMKLVSSALPYVLISAHHRFGMLEHIIYLRLLTI
jgi:hypothetical protein